MLWIKATNGPVNLAKVVRIVCQTNGDAYLYTDTSNYVTISLGVDAASARAVADRLTDAVDPAEY